MIRLMQNKWIIIVAIIVVGLTLGWQAVSYGFTQTWWPFSISGQPETVVSGSLVTNLTGVPTGLVIQNSGQTTYVDMSRLSSRTITAHLNRKITARGYMIQADSGNYLLISWLK